MTKKIIVPIAVLIFSACIKKRAPQIMFPEKPLNTINNINGCYQNIGIRGGSLSYIFSKNDIRFKNLSSNIKYICLEANSNSIKVKYYNMSNRVIHQNIFKDFTFKVNKIVSNKESRGLKNGAIGLNIDEFYLTVDNRHNLISTHNSIGAGVIVVIPMIAGTSNINRFSYIGEKRL